MSTTKGHLKAPALEWKLPAKDGGYTIYRVTNEEAWSQNVDCVVESGYLEPTPTGDITYIDVTALTS